MKRLLSALLAIVLFVGLTPVHVLAALDIEGDVVITASTGLGGQQWVQASVVNFAMKDGVVDPTEVANHEIRWRLISGTSSGTWAAYTTGQPASVSLDGIYEVQAAIFRKADNVIIGQQSSKIVYVDAAAPTGKLEVVGPILRLSGLGDARSGFDKAEITLAPSSGGTQNITHTGTADWTLAMEEGVTYNVIARLLDKAGNALFLDGNYKVNTTAYAKPVISVDYTGEWVNRAFELSVAITAPADNWRYEVYSAVSGSRVLEGSSSETTINLPDGIYNLKVFAFNTLAPSIEVSAEKTISIDTGKPTLNYTEIKGTGTPPGLVVAASDTRSGVKSISYRLNGAPAKTVSSGSTIYAEIQGSNTFEIWSTNNAGNNSDTKTVSLNWDPGNMAPTLTIQGETSSKQESWYNKDITVNVAATNLVNGLSRILVDVNGEFEQITGSGDKISGSIKLTEDGSYTIKATAYDGKGAISGSEATRTVGVDKTNPSPPTVTYSGSSITIREGDDDGSGVKEVRYSVKVGGSSNNNSNSNNNNSSQGSMDAEVTNEVYSSSFSIRSDGIYTVEAWTVDNAGNKSSNTTRQITIDTTPPEPPDIEVSLVQSDSSNNTSSSGTSSSGASPGWFNGPVDVKISHGRAGLSGINYTEYKMSGATSKNWTSVQRNSSASFQITNPGVTTITAITYSEAGLASDETVYRVRIDKDKPRLLVTPLTKLTPASITFKASIQATSNVSGIKEIVYSIDGGDEKVVNWESGQERGTITIPLRPTEGDSDRTITITARNHAGFVTSEEIFAAGLAVQGPNGELVDDPTAGATGTTGTPGAVVGDGTGQVSVNPGTGRRRQ